MRADIAAALQVQQTEFPTARQPTVLVHWIPYMDMLAEDVGCRPSPLRLLFSPRLLWKVRETAERKSFIVVTTVAASNVLFSTR